MIFWTKTSIVECSVLKLWCGGLTRKEKLGERRFRKAAWTHEGARFCSQNRLIWGPMIKRRLPSVSTRPRIFFKTWDLLHIFCALELYMIPLLWVLVASFLLIKCLLEHWLLYYLLIKLGTFSMGYLLYIYGDWQEMIAVQGLNRNLWPSFVHLKESLVSFQIFSTT